MTLEAFRAKALTMIQRGEPCFGQQFIDHADGTVYDCTRWANAPAIAVDEYWTRDHRDYWTARRRAMLDEATWHYPR
jgi:hypothetical protein